MSKSAITMLALIIFAIVGGPLIFYGLVFLGDAGAFDNALDNFWLIVGAGLGFVVLVWVAVLAIGNLALKADLSKEQLDG